MIKITLYTLCFLLVGLGVVFMWVVYPPKVRATVSRNGGHLLCTFRLSRSKRAVHLWEIVLSRDWASVSGATPPDGFREEPLEHTRIPRGDDRDVETFNRNNIRWVGDLVCPPGEDVTLSIPLTFPLSLTSDGVLAFRYTRHDRMGSVTESCTATVSARVPDKLLLKNI